MTLPRPPQIGVPRPRVFGEGGNDAADAFCEKTRVRRRTVHQISTPALFHRKNPRFVTSNLSFHSGKRPNCPHARTLLISASIQRESRAPRVRRELLIPEDFTCKSFRSKILRTPNHIFELQVQWIQYFTQSDSKERNRVDPRSDSPQHSRKWQSHPFLVAANRNSPAIQTIV